MHFEGLDGGFERCCVLVQPELHGLELGNAFIELFHIQGGRNPTAKLRHTRHGRRSAGSGLAAEIFQKIKARHQFAEVGEMGLVSVAHGFSRCLMLSTLNAIVQ